MKNAKHTQGEWEAHGNGIFPKGQSRNICIVESCRESEANARLIASAPELLEALTELVEDLKMDKYNYRLATMSKVEKAIAKATGK